MTFLTPDHLVHLAALSRKATPRLWELGGIKRVIYGQDNSVITVCDDYKKLGEDNAAYIVACANACDALLAEVEAGRRVVEASQKLHGAQLHDLIELDGKKLSNALALYAAAGGVSSPALHDVAHDQCCVCGDRRVADVPNAGKQPA